MRTEKKSSIKNSATRLILIGLLVLIQTGWMIFLMMKLNTYSTAITLLLTHLLVQNLAHGAEQQRGARADGGHQKFNEQIHYLAPPFLPRPTKAYRTKNSLPRMKKRMMPCKTSAQSEERP